MENLPFLIYLSSNIFLLGFLAYSALYYQKAKKHGAEMGLNIPLWIKRIFILLFTFLITLIVGIFAWLVIWLFTAFFHIK